MAKRTIFCENCDSEFIVTFKGEEEPNHCVFCGEEVDVAWNTKVEFDE